MIDVLEDENNMIMKKSMPTMWDYGPHAYKGSTMRINNDAINDDDHPRTSMASKLNIGFKI